MKLTSSVAIPTCNRPEDIIGLLESLEQQTIIPDEIIIVDSSNVKLTDLDEFNKKFNSQFFSKSKLIYKHSQVKGTSLQRNICISLSSCDLVHFLDDDVRPEKDYVEQMTSVFLKHSEYAGGMATVINCFTNMSLSRFIKIIFLLQRDGSTGLFTASGLPTHPYGTEKFRNIEVINTGCGTYRLSVLKKFNFDESLGVYSYMEDCDLSKRISKQYPLFFNPKAKTVHLVSKKNRMNIVDNRALYIRNYSYLFFKNFYPENRLRIFAYLWSIVGLFVEAIIYRKKDYLKGYFKGLRNYYFKK